MTFLHMKFQFGEQFRPTLSLRGAQRRGNLKEQKALELTERSPRLHLQPRDDMRYTMTFQLFAKLEFEMREKLGLCAGMLDFKKAVW